MIIGLLMLVSGMFAGAFGALLGLGGGVLLVPLLTLGFGRPLRESVAVALVCVIVTSSAASGAHIQRRTANLRLGLVLALFTAVGSVVGGVVAFLIPERYLAGLFAALLVYVCITMARGATRRADHHPATPAAPGSEQAAAVANATDAPDASFAARISAPGYRVQRLVPASGASVFSGLMSALLGVGGGVINVPVMNVLMRVPLRVATATSNLVVGVTAIASAIIYLVRGEIDPYVAGPTALGVFVGATIGARSAHRVDVRILRALFVVVLGWTAFQMARRALGA